ncbi:peptidase [Tropicibacter sp. R15_0]|uniref:peptidase n=1 Tax=Tropicibacter sp. R15_0 TaxID=2821101 RepID=UPI001AD97DE1|nr:peptidase [Tropicibacter sp. R15_0]MBO9467067.1 peptidase [Tropicibacter sp. R15_0]
MPEILDRTRVHHAAKGWIGTPFVQQGDLRGAGADCVGLVRGLWRELSGVYVPPPAWRSDWAVAPGEPILRGLCAHLVQVRDACPGTIAVFRVGRKRAAHLGILTERGVIHAHDALGVIEIGRGGLPAPGSLWAFPQVAGA